MNLKTKNYLCGEAWEAGRPEFAGMVLRSKKATEEDGFKLVKTLREKGIEEAENQLSKIEFYV